MGYKIVLVNLGKCVSDDLQKKITALLGSPTGLFDAVVKKYDETATGTKYATADVTWTDSAPSVSTHELVCYFVRNSSDSVIKHMNGFKSGSSSASGMTYPEVGSPVGSEVYVADSTSSKNQAAALANLVFHELMHNKLRWGDAKLHGKDGGGGLAKDTVDSETKMTDTNRDIMAKALPNSVPQWTGGVDSYNDPMNNHI